MKREARAVLLVLVGAVVLHLSLLTDAYLRYVRTSMRPYLIASGAVLLLLGLVRAVSAVQALLQERRGGRTGEPGGEHPAHPDHGDGDGSEGDDDGHGHNARGPRIAWLLTLPVLTVLLVAPPALGAYTAQHSAGTVARPATADTGFPALPAGSPLVLPLADFEVRAVWDTSQSLKGRKVEMIGFAVPAPKAAKGTGGTTGKDKGTTSTTDNAAGTGVWYLTRLTLTCCAADAVTYRVEVHGVTAPPQGSWVEVTGVWLPNGQAGRDGAVPALNASRATAIPTPHNPYD